MADETVVRKTRQIPPEIEVNTFDSFRAGVVRGVYIFAIVFAAAFIIALILALVNADWEWPALNVAILPDSFNLGTLLPLIVLLALAVGLGSLAFGYTGDTAVAILLRAVFIAAFTLVTLLFLILLFNFVAGLVSQLKVEGLELPELYVPYWPYILLIALAVAAVMFVYQYTVLGVVGGFIATILVLWLVALAFGFIGEVLARASGDLGIAPTELGRALGAKMADGLATFFLILAIILSVLLIVSIFFPGFWLGKIMLAIVVALLWALVVMFPSSLVVTSSTGVARAAVMQPTIAQCNQVYERKKLRPNVMHDINLFRCEQVRIKMESGCADLYGYVENKKTYLGKTCAGQATSVRKGLVVVACSQTEAVIRLLYCHKDAEGNSMKSCSA